ncbi:hypothetical protein D9758_008469 [Tetrapyrgos nigripes]|uniref:Uncharacterized protein n=1 Tax=Tetrapyrgos nigripes TaxID=182062 RepID=A0A8H5FQV3_9AGAR|nr:hypothetical protein D9758_008469 [Tetrapyrgos nigripes]
MPETLPITAEDIAASSARKHLLCVNGLMKNTLIRALNRILAVVPSIKFQCDDASVIGFMEYIAVFCDMALLHLAGDERFLKSTEQGPALIEVFGSESNPNVPHLREGLEKLRAATIGWKESPATATAQELEGLLGEGDELAKTMVRQWELMRDGDLGKDLEDETLGKMIQENIAWISGNSDITVLLPFILAHHDPATAEAWPQVTDEGLAEVPKMVELRKECWKFAPFDPATRNLQALAL